jgi:serine phosphatase RsbU (regulator of sigma subunit)/PAS domain-containing protein
VAVLLLVDLTDEQRAFVAGTGVPSRATTADALAPRLEHEVVAVLVHVRDPQTGLRVVQRVHRALADVRIAVLVDADVEAAFRRAVRFAPDVPVDLEVLDPAAADLPQRVTELHGSGSARRRHARIMEQIGTQGSTRTPAPVGANLGTLLEQAPLGVVVLDRDEQPVAWNAKAAGLLHLRTEASRTSLADVFLDPAAVGSLVTAAFASTSREPGAVRTTPGRNGLHLDVSASRSRLEDGRDVVMLLVQDATARRRAELERDRLSVHVALISGASEAVISTQDPHEALERLAARVVPTLADWVEMQVYDERGTTVSVLARHSDPAYAELSRFIEQELPRSMSDQSPSRRIARGEGPFLMPHITPEMLESFVPHAPLRAVLQDVGIDSAIAVPLAGRDRVLGSMVLLNRAPAAPFGDTELTVAVEVGRRAGMALEALQHSRRQQALAETLQRSMLTEPPAPAHAEIEVRYRPAADEAQVGGDWYDSYLQPDGSIVLSIGDVVGHDFQAAAAMGQLRGLLRGIGYARGDGPAAMLQQLDGAIEGLLAGTTATAVVARISAADQARPEGSLTMTWSNAGHPPPMLLPARGRALVLASEPTDLILGVIPEIPRVEHRVELGPGDTVLLYSDGLVERRDRDLDDGLAELGAVLTELRDLPLADLCERLLERLVIVGHEDDIAIIAVRLR